VIGNWLKTEVKKYVSVLRANMWINMDEWPAAAVPTLFVEIRWGMRVPNWSFQLSWI
jgi:hypothetical protein